MTDKPKTAQGSVNAELKPVVTFKVRFGNKTKAWTIEDGETLQAAVYTPKQLIEALLRKDKAALINRGAVYAPETTWWQNAKTKESHIPVAVVLAWIEQGGELVYGRTKFWGQKAQLQSTKAFEHSAAGTDELGEDDLLF